MCVRAAHVAVNRGRREERLSLYSSVKIPPLIMFLAYSHGRMDESDC
jgi:hypothetical protein